MERDSAGNLVSTSEAIQPLGKGDGSRLPVGVAGIDMLLTRGLGDGRYYTQAQVLALIAAIPTGATDVLAGIFFDKAATGAQTTPIPAGAKSALVFATGGGGGAGSGARETTATVGRGSGGGGGAGATCGKLYDVSAGGNLSYNIGAGGAGGAAISGLDGNGNNGSGGGNTTVDYGAEAQMIAPGGYFGNGGLDNMGTAGTNGRGGGTPVAATAADFDLGGGAGDCGTYGHVAAGTSFDNGQGGNGGASFWGGGARGAETSLQLTGGNGIDGSDGEVPGSGGGGGGAEDNTSGAGGDGADGCIFVLFFK